MVRKIKTNIPEAKLKKDLEKYRQRALERDLAFDRTAAGDFAFLVFRFRRLGGAGEAPETGRQQSAERDGRELLTERHTTIPLQFRVDWADAPGSAR